MGKVRLCFLAVLCFLLMGSTVLVRADGIPPDPTMGIRDPLCTGDCPSPVFDLTFTFGADENGGGIFTMTNQTGVNWSSLLFQTSGNPANTITCVGTAFINCQVFDVGGGFTDIFYSGVGFVGDPFFPGIVNGDTFTIDLNNDQSCTVSCSGGWGPGRGFSVTASTPEPATITLLGAGLGALLAKRKLRKSNSRA